MEGTPYFYAENGGIFMKNGLQEKLEHMMARPIPKKKIGVVRLQMVKESQTLYGMRRFSNSKEDVQIVRPLFQMADREMVLEIAAVGGMSSCYLDLKSIFKHALLNNASYIVCFHNHVSGYAEPSDADKILTDYSGPPIHPGRSLAQSDRASAHLLTLIHFDLSFVRITEGVSLQI